MDIDITKTNENKLFERKELKGEIAHFGESTPKRAQLRELLSAKLNVDKAVVSIRKILSTFGGKTKLSAIIYNTKEAFDKFEPKYIIKRHPAEEKKEAIAEKVEGQ